MSAREELLAEARRLLWQGWERSSEEIGSAAASTLMGLGMLVPQGGAAELERLRSLLNAQPAELTEAQLDVLIDAGNGALSDYYHERQCACSEYPAGCVTNPAYRREGGCWDTDAFAIGLGAVLGLWESMRADVAAAELGALRARAASLTESLRDAADQVARLESDLGGAAARVAELEAAAAKVARFCAPRAEYVDNLRNCNPDNGHDYDRWQGHAAARRQLSQLLGLPVGWPAEDKAPAPHRQQEDPHTSPLHHDYAVSRDLPTTTIETSGSAL